MLIKEIAKPPSPEEARVKSLNDQAKRLRDQAKLAKAQQRVRKAQATLTRAVKPAMPSAAF